MRPQRANPTSPTIGIEEAAALLRCGVRTVRTLIATGELPALQLSQRQWVLLRDDVLEFIRVRAHRQANARKAERARQHAKDSATPVVVPRRSGRKRRPLPDLDRYERLLL